MRLRIFIIAIMLSVVAEAQDVVTFRFGCVSYHDALITMPEYAAAQDNIAALRQQYDAELAAAQEEFNEKYEAFLKEYTTYAPAILRKRQAELEDLLTRNETFRDDATRLLHAAEDELLAPVYDKLRTVIANIAADYSLAFVINTDDEAIPFVNLSMAYNITNAVIDRLSKP